MMIEDNIDVRYNSYFPGQFDVDILNNMIRAATRLYEDSKASPEIDRVYDKGIDAVDFTGTDNPIAIKKHIASGAIKGTYLKPGILTKSINDNNQSTDWDVYLYASAAMLAEATNAVKKVLPENSAMDKILPLDVCIPKNLEDRLGVDKKEAGDPYLLVRRAATQIIEKMETSLSLITTYYSAYEQRIQASQPLEQFVTQQIEEVRICTKYMRPLIPILKNFAFYTEAGALKATADIISTKGVLEEAIRKDKLYNVYKNILSTHALLVGEKFTGSPYMFMNLTGEEIELSMLIAKNARDAMSALAHINSENHIDKKRHLIAGEDHYLQITDANALRKIIKEDGYSIAVANLTNSIHSLNEYMKMTTKPFSDLTQRLEAFGIPFEVAKSIEENLSMEKLDRVITVNDKLGKLSLKQAVILANSKGEQAISGYNALMSKVTGVPEKKIWYKFYGKYSKNKVIPLEWAPGISNIAYVTTLNPNKDIELYREFFSTEHETVLEDRLRTLYPHHDSYARMNTGACFLLNANHLGMIVNNKNPVIELRDVYSQLKDKQAADDLRAHVDCHEPVHKCQIGKPVINRWLTSSVMNWASREAVIHLQDGDYNRPMPFRANNRTTVIKSWKDTLIDITASCCVPFLATGKIGEKYRNESFFATIMAQRINPLDEKNLDLNYSELFKVKLEESLTVNLFHKTLDLLKSGNVDDIKENIIAIQNHEQELLSIIEHMAESFALYGSKLKFDILANSKDEKRLAQLRYDSLKRNIVGRGEWAKLYQDTIRIVEHQHLDEALREKGMVYNRATSRTKGDNIEAIIANTLGYSAYEPNDAYHDLITLEKKAKRAGIDMKDILMDMNGAKALLGLRYSTLVDLYMDVISKYGGPKAFNLLCNSETTDQVRQLLAT